MKKLTVITCTLFMVMSFMDTGFASETGRKGRERAWRKIQQNPVDIEKIRELQEKQIRKKQAQEALMEKIEGLRSKGILLPYVKYAKHEIHYATRSDRIQILLWFINYTPYTIEDLLYELKIIDNFGDILHQSEIKDHRIIAGWDWDTNPKSIYIEDYGEVYKLKIPVESRAVRVQVTIKKIIWKSGGITGNFPPEKKKAEKEK